MGFFYSLARPVYFFIIPSSQEAKYSGVYSCALVILSWVPLLALTLSYEATGSLSGGFNAMACFLAVGFVCIASVDMKDARARVVGTPPSGEKPGDLPESSL